jgi:hypothetical protein
VRCQDSAECGVKRDAFYAAGREVDRGTEAALGFIAVEDLEKLFLLTHTAF